MPKVCRAGNITYVTIDLQQRGLRRLLQRLRQPHAVAAVPLPARSVELRPRLVRRLPRVNQLFAEQLYPLSARRRPGLGARLPPDPAGRGAAPARRQMPASASSCTCRSRRPRCYVALPWHDAAGARRCAPTICVGFQTSNDLRNFHDYLYREGGAATRSPTASIAAFGRTLRAQALPDRHRHRRLRRDGDLGRGGAREPAAVAQPARPRS